MDREGTGMIKMSFKTAHLRAARDAIAGKFEKLDAKVKGLVFGEDRMMIWQCLSISRYSWAGSVC